jgi:hypothetical protein
MLYMAVFWDVAPFGLVETHVSEELTASITIYQTTERNVTEHNQPLPQSSP